MQSSPRQPVAGRTAQSVAAAVVLAAEGLGLTEQEAARLTAGLTAGLTAVAASQFTVTDVAPSWNAGQPPSTSSTRTRFSTW